MEPTHSCHYRLCITAYYGYEHIGFHLISLTRLNILGGVAPITLGTPNPNA